MINEMPWYGLKFGGVDSRRVSASGKWNFFWTIMAKDTPALVLTVEELPSPLPKLPVLRSLELGFANRPEGPTFFLCLRDLGQIEIFETLCRDVVAGGETAEDEHDALSRCISRTCRWHHLLRGGRSQRLNEDEQKGLIGELAVLEWLSDRIGSKGAITAWRGPSGAPKDFEFFEHCIEVKARRAGAKPYIQVSNEFQLSDVREHRLWLAVLAVDRVSEPFGEPLNAHVSRVEAKISSGDPTALIEWEAALAAAGYRQEDDYSDFRWVFSPPTWHEVLPSFPRIVEPLPIGVMNVKYAIALSACAPFQVEPAVIDTAISKGYVDAGS